MSRLPFLNFFQVAAKSGRALPWLPHGEDPEPDHAAAYYEAACRFSEWCEGRELHHLAQVKSFHAAGYIEGLTEELGSPT